ncbi:DUF5643 domain-containing protein [Paenibacillus silvae]|jgi:hypothetical protein|uniref:DUF5643 domain-containing protein n=1 Tax=Paenibacillus silvae TaxID=1325358 RepID=UPI003CEDA5BE
MKDQMKKNLSIRKVAVACFMAAAVTTTGTGALWNSSTIAEAAQASTTNAKSVTHDGVKLTLSEVEYDGLSLKITIKREGKGLPEGMIASYNQKNIVKGHLKTPEILINGQKDSKATFGLRSHLKEKNSAILEYKSDSLPDQFELTLRMPVSGIKENFEFKIPVKKQNGIIHIKPNQTKESKGFSYTVKKINITSTQTQLVLDSKGKVPASSKQTGVYAPTMMYYDIVDDQGKTVKQKQLSFYSKKPRTTYHINELYDAVSPQTKSITIKPYTFTVKLSDWSIVGEKVDKKGKVVSSGTKTYIKELEMKVKIKK